MTSLFGRELLARLHRLGVSADGGVHHVAYCVEACSSGYGVTVCGFWNTNGSAVELAEALSVLWRTDLDRRVVMRWEAVHPLVPQYPETLVELWEGIVRAYDSVYDPLVAPTEHSVARLAETRARAREEVLRIMKAKGI